MRLGFAPFYWAFLFYTLFVFLIPGTFQVSNDNYYWFWSGGYDKTIIAVAILFLYLAIGSFELGYRFGFGSAGRFSNSTPRRHRAGERALPARSPSRQVVMIVVGAAAGLLVLAILQIGIEGFIGTRAAVSARFQEIAGASNVSRGIFSALVRQISIIALLFSLWYFISKWKKDVYATPLFVAAIAISYFALNPVAMPRFITLGTALSILMIIVVQFRLSLNFIIFMPPIGLYLIAPMISSFNRSEQVTAFKYIPINEYLLHGDFACMQVLIIAVQYTFESGFRYGHQLLSALFFFVPRSIWEGKAEPTGVFLAENEGFPFTNLSSTIFAELWIDFGVLGFIVFVLIGWLFGRMDKKICSGSTSIILVLGTIAFVGTLPMLLRGSLLGVLPQVAFLLAIPVMLKVGFDAIRKLRKPIGQ